MAASHRMPHRAAFIPILLGVGAALMLILISGCKMNGFNASASCDNNGNNCSANFHQSTPPSVKHTHTPNPAVTITETETPTEPVVTASPVEVGPCSVYLTQQDMRQLAISEPAREDLMNCMQIPGDQRPEMDNWLAEHALDRINTPSERRHWEEHQLAGAYRQYGG